MPWKMEEACSQDGPWEATPWQDLHLGWASWQAAQAPNEWGQAEQDPPTSATSTFHLWPDPRMAGTSASPGTYPGSRHDAFLG